MELRKECCGNCKNWFSRSCPNNKIILSSRKFGSNMNPDNIACSNYLPEDVQDGVDTFAQEKTQSGESVKVMVDEAPAVLHIVQWVNVENGLPKTPEHVLCYSLEHGRIVGSYYPIGKYFITAMGGRLRDVTHWMPLPPSPKFNQNR